MWISTTNRSPSATGPFPARRLSGASLTSQSQGFLPKKLIILVCPPLPTVAPPFLPGAGTAADGFFFSPAPAVAVVVVEEAEDVREGAGGAAAACFLGADLADGATTWGELSSVSANRRKGCQRRNKQAERK